MASFTQELWASIEPIYQAILSHPFLKGLADGSLPEEKFRFYVIQDALYLRDFARALAAAASRSPKDEWTEFLSRHARETLVAERALHDSFFKDWGLTPEQVYSTPIAPTNLAYTSYLLRVAYLGSFEEAVASLLPCDWIYLMVGRELEKTGSPHPLYKRWIETYSSEEFSAVVEELRKIVETVSAWAGPELQGIMRAHFVTTSRYEWMFWDMAWRMESWPI
ncbi:MAG: thiaminase II [Anaerolineae bacterium]|nr:thiaminase II [Anaerolineae bacterium]MDW8101495.1 thiaminase II [Anaerolineae bacterium]